MAEEWLTAEQAAELSGFNVQYIRRLLRTHRIEGRKFGRMIWQVNRASLSAYLKEAEKHKSEDRRRGPRT